MEKFTIIAKDDLAKLPTTSGVYCFYQDKRPIYIGKAINIKDRVKNHFKQPTYKDDFFTGVTDRIGFLETGSEIEALILEAQLIKKYQPKFNSVWRDDKNYFYVAVGNWRGTTRKNAEKLPYVFITHQIHKSKIINHTSKTIGPFVEGTALKKTLKYLRRVFPFYTAAKHPATKCTWCHLGLCPGPRLFEEARLASPSGEAANLLKDYKKNIKKLMLILQGKRKTVLYALKKEMAELSKHNKFEEAATVRDKMQALEQVMAHTHVIENSKLQYTNHKLRNLPNEKWRATEKLLQEILQMQFPISKIECYDISNIQGIQAVGSMVVFVNGAPDKSQYKKFRIRMENKPNDIAMLKEVLGRRLAHPEWGYPQVMLIDGGIAQLNVGIKSKTPFPEAKNIKIISIAKGRQELFIEGQEKNPIPLKNLPQEIYNLIVHLDDEAHRFAISYHKKLRKKALLK